MYLTQLNAITKKERNAATTVVMDTIVMQGGWVEDVHFYSNLMTTVNFQMPGKKLLAFIYTLDQQGIHAEGITQEVLRPTNLGEIRGSIQLNFVHAEPDLRREVPPVPG
jgi:hypothetical protein